MDVTKEKVESIVIKYRKEKKRTRHTDLRIVNVNGSVSYLKNKVNKRVDKKTKVDKVTKGETRNNKKKGRNEKD